MKRGFWKNKFVGLITANDMIAAVSPNQNDLVPTIHKLHSYFLV